MPFTYLRRAAVALALLASAGCTIKNTEAPPLTGPSGLALTLNVNATPDSISQDGGSQSSVKVTAIGPDGQPVVGLPLRLDMIVGGVAQDFGTLSARSVVTNNAGVATAIFTAPPSPPNGVFGTCSGLPGNCVSIVATPTSTNFATANPEQVQIRLVPTGVILPPAGSPTASFTVSPTPATEDIPLNFDASASTIGTGATSLTYAWTFGDGATGTGKTTTHTYPSDGTYTVVLTVTNDRQLSASSSQQLTVTAATVTASLTANFTFSPGSPVAFDNIVFDASSSTTAPGTSVARLDWNFGDSTGTISCPSAPQCNGTRIVSHSYTSGGTFTVNLVLTDSAGHTGSHATPITVGSGNPTAVLTVIKNGGTSVTADGSTSTASGGATISTYQFFWGDGTSTSATGASSASHSYGAVGTFTVTMRVVDCLVRTGNSAPVTVTVP